MLHFLQVLLDNAFDKSLLAKRQVPQHVQRVAKSLLEYHTANMATALDNAFLGIVLKDALVLLVRVLRDPVLSKELRPEAVVGPVLRFLRVANTLQPRTEDPDASGELYGSADPFVRIVEASFQVLAGSSTDLKACQYYASQLAEDDAVARAAFTTYRNPYLVCRGLRVLRRYALALDDPACSTPFHARMKYLRPNAGAFGETLSAYTGAPAVATALRELCEVLALSDRKRYEMARNTAFGLLVNAKEVDAFCT